MSDLLPDFPKIEPPFIRKHYKVNFDDWKKHGKKLQLRKPEVYLITREVNEKCAWVFDESAYAVEKLDGTNIAIETSNGNLIKVQNRLNKVEFTKVVGNADHRFLKGILNSSSRKYLEADGIQYGELVGPKINTNHYDLGAYLFYPFELAKTRLRYKSFDRYPKEFWGWCDWFRCDLFSLFYRKIHNSKSTGSVPYAEGIVIYSSDSKMSKLRRDMYPWYYWNDIHIENLDDDWLEYAKKHNISVRGY